MFEYYTSLIISKNIPCDIEKGIDGKHYAVFPDSYTAEEYAREFDDCPIVCFGQYENAYLIED